jgi:hypothetical protein
MAKSALAFSGPVILFASLFLFAGCGGGGGDKVELAKTDVKPVEPNLEGKKREDLPRHLRPPAKGTSYGITHDPSKGAGAASLPPP